MTLLLTSLYQQGFDSLSLSGQQRIIQAQPLLMFLSVLCLMALVLCLFVAAYYVVTSLFTDVGWALRTMIILVIFCLLMSMSLHSVAQFLYAVPYPDED
jgi:hypothetical protein